MWHDAQLSGGQPREVDGALMHPNACTSPRTTRAGSTRLCLDFRRRHARGKARCPLGAAYIGTTSLTTELRNGSCTKYLMGRRMFEAMLNLASTGANTALCRSGHWAKMLANMESRIGASLLPTRRCYSCSHLHPL